MQHAIPNAYIALYSLKSEERSKKLTELLTKNPNDPFLHFWRIIECTGVNKGQVNQNALQESLQLIFSDTTDAGLFARSTLLYQASQPIVDYATKIGYFDTLTTAENADDILQEINSNFAQNNQLDINNPADLPIIHGFHGLTKAAKNGFIPAKLELATGHYHWQAMAENPQQRDRTSFYYQQLEYLNQCGNFVPAEIQKIFLLLDTPPIFDEETHLCDAQSLLQRCRMIPTSTAHEAYVSSIECYKEGYKLLRSDNYLQQSQLLGDTALKIALNYFQFVDELTENQQEQKIIDFFKRKAKEQLTIAVREGNNKAKIFQAYLLAKNPFGKTIIHKEKLQDLLKDFKDPEHFSSELSYFNHYESSMRDVFYKLNQTWGEFPLLVGQKDQQSYSPSSLLNRLTKPLQRPDNPHHVLQQNQKNYKRKSTFIKSFSHKGFALVGEPSIEALRLGEATVKTMVKTPSKMLTHLARSVSPSNENCIFHPLNPNLTEIIQQDKPTINPIKAKDLFRGQLTKFNHLYVQQKSLSYFKANFLGDYDSMLLIKIHRYLAKTKHTDAVILTHIEKITTFKGHPLYNPEGDLAKIIHGLYLSLNQTKKPKQVLPPHILKFHEIILSYEEVINQRKRQFTDPYRIAAIFDLREKLDELAQDKITTADFYHFAVKTYELFDDAHLGDMLFDLCQAAQSQVTYEHTLKSRAAPDIEHKLANAKPATISRVRL